MRIIQCESTSEAVRTAASIILEKIEAEKNPVIGLATGKTMEPVYSAMVSEVKERNLNMEKVFFFMLDEYAGLPLDHPSTFRSYIRKHFLLPLNIPESQIAFPPADLKDGGEVYETLLKNKGGIDLQLLGIGRNGHVGFNEPGSSRESRTRVVKLTQETIEANRDQFTDRIPSEALSMGIGTILESRNLLMLATGKSKAETIKFLLNHHNDSGCPATFIKDHPHFTLVLDPEAASKINLKI